MLRSPRACDNRALACWDAKNCPALLTYKVDGALGDLTFFNRAVASDSRGAQIGHQNKNPHLALLWFDDVLQAHSGLA